MADAKMNNGTARRIDTAPSFRRGRWASRAHHAAMLLPRAALLLVLIACTALAGCKEEPTGPETMTVKIGDETFKLELALTDRARYRGLSDRPSIPADGGMLFAFRSPRELSFVMRKCLVPIDIIYLNARGRIVQMHRMKVQPYDTPEEDLIPYPSRWPSQFAIELADGSLDRLKLQTGQQIVLPYDDLKKRAQ